MNSTLKKILFTTSAVTVALGMSAAMLYTGLLANDGKDNTISGNFGSTYGIHDITSSANEGIAGLPSNTVSFQVSDINPIGALQHTSKFLEDETEGNGDSELLNLKISSDEDSTSGFNFEFYANSPADYLDGTFNESVSALNGLVSEGGFSEVTLISKPTKSGTRSLDVSVMLDSGVTSKTALQTSWSKLLTAVSSFPLNGSRYNLSMATEGDVSKGISGFYYDEASFELLKQVDPRVWSTLEIYTGKTTFGPMGIIEAKYVMAQGAGTNDSAFRLTIAGDQPDAAAVDALVKNFKASAYDNPEVMLPWMNITTLQYQNSTDAVYTDYPTNMIWEQ